MGAATRVNTKAVLPRNQCLGDAVDHGDGQHWTIQPEPEPANPYGLDAVAAPEPEMWHLGLPGGGDRTHYGGYGGQQPPLTAAGQRLAMQGGTSICVRACFSERR
jgi:hypothetical protein